MARTSLTSIDGRGPTDPAAGGARQAPSPRRPARERTLWNYWSKRPPATLVWLLVIWMSFATMPSANSAWPAGAPTGIRGSSKVPWANLVRRSGVIVAVGPGEDKPGEVVLGAAWFDYRLRSEFEGRYVTITGSGLKPADMAPARAAYVSWLASSKDPYWKSTAAKLGGGDRVSTIGFRWRRIGQTIIGLFIAPALLFRSLLWAAPLLAAAGNTMGRFSSDPIERERQRRRRALGKHQCPACGYNIIGLPERRCPECNETWGRHELAG